MSQSLSVFHVKQFKRSIRMFQWWFVCKIYCKNIVLSSWFQVFLAFKPLRIKNWKQKSPLSLKSLWGSLWWAILTRSQPRLCRCRSEASYNSANVARQLALTSCENWRASEFSLSDKALPAAICDSKISRDLVDVVNNGLKMLTMSIIWKCHRCSFFLSLPVGTF